jgi:hypothetical protein
MLAQKLILLTGETPEQFDLTLSEHLRRFQPRDEVEYCQVVEMVRAQWCLFRAFTAETGILEKHNTGNPPETLGAPIKDRTLDLLPRYQARLQLAYQRAIRTLILIRTNFPLDPNLPDDPQPEQADPPVAPAPQAPRPPQPAATPATPPEIVAEPAKPAAPPDDWPKAA